MQCLRCRAARRLIPARALFARAFSAAPIPAAQPLAAAQLAHPTLPFASEQQDMQSSLALLEEKLLHEKIFG